jgi:hypothetical protein
MLLARRRGVFEWFALTGQPPPVALGGQEVGALERPTSGHEEPSGTALRVPARLDRRGLAIAFGSLAESPIRGSPRCCEGVTDTRKSSGAQDTWGRPERGPVSGVWVVRQLGLRGSAQHA